MDKLWGVVFFAVGVMLILFILTITKQSKLNEEPAGDQLNSLDDIRPKITTMTREKKVRKPAVAGQFYPGNAEDLDEMVTMYLTEAEDKNLKNIRVLISPHAGYIYSGPTAGVGFRQIAGGDFDKIFVLAPTHQKYFKGASIADATHYKTPFGDIPMDYEIIEQLFDHPLFSQVSGAHSKEHSLEVQLPFLQKTIENFELIPIVIGDASPQEKDQIADEITRHIDDNTLIVVSTDLSHYTPYETAMKLDDETTKAIEKLDVEWIDGCKDRLCGKQPVSVVMRIAKNLGWKPRVLDYKNSGDTAGSKSQVVGYVSIAMTGDTPEGTVPSPDDIDDPYTDEQKEYLLKLARDTVEAVVRGEGIPTVSRGDVDPLLYEHSGVFVTLEKNGRLRGCIGHIIAQEPLVQAVIDNSISAATRDSRFNRVGPGELDDIKVEVSILTAPKDLDYADGDDLLNKLRPDVDGVVLKKGWNSATYLPTVWAQIPDKKQFLSNLCRKAGLSTDCWKKGVGIKTYQAIVFSEEGFDLH